MQNKVFLWIALGTAAILSVPLTAIQLTNEVDWNVADLTVTGILLFSIGFVFVLVARVMSSRYRSKLFPVAIGGFILIMALAIYGYFPYFLKAITHDTNDGFVERIWHTEYFTFPIISGNFEPTFYHGDTVLFTKKKPNRKLKRGDLVFYEIPFCSTKDRIPSSCYYFSRVVGLPGEEIVLRERHIEVNGKSLTENYAQWRRYETTALLNSKYELNKPILIHASHYFLLDDDRTWSNSDSRLFGPISREKITGYFKFRLYRNYITKYPPPLF